ncbi:hypothetical protein RB195_011590 [Necator americanus]|uniref:Uncharacterized protein n=1 Tax=Necator americanus TaxID=51031 RepID=A0ABR1D425_NECAM
MEGDSLPLPYGFLRDHYYWTSTYIRVHRAVTSLSPENAQTGEKEPLSHGVWLLSLDTIKGKKPASLMLHYQYTISEEHEKNPRALDVIDELKKKK